MMSNDGGKTFKSTDKSGTTHSDWHGCWINPNRESHWVTANDGGCNITYDNGQHWFKINTLPVYGALLEGESVYNTAAMQTGILLIGNESKGIREELLPFITHPVSIPRIGAAESLNAAVATGILLSHLVK